MQAIYGPPYIKVVVEPEIINEYYFYGDEWYEANLHTYVNFYEDAACTISATLLIPRYLNVNYFEQWNAGGYVSSYSTVIIPAGVSRYKIGTGYTFWHEIQGGSVGSARIEYSVVNK